MRDPIARYLEDVLCYADLAPRDERSVRAELSEHLHELTAPAQSSNPTEVYAMLKDQFGTPKRVGRGIAAAKGRLRTYFKKTARKLPLRVGIVLVLAFAVRYAVAQSFYVPGNSVSPAIPRGSRILVYKLAKSFDPGDVVVYRFANGEFRVGIIVHQSHDGGWLVEKNNGSTKERTDVARQDIVGRVFLNTR
jgi:uncharacterized protein YijF (DUF1287 family)